MYSEVATLRILTGFTSLNENGEEKISDETIERAIDQADSTINAKIGDRYQLPLPSTPKIIEMISEQIAKGILYAEEYGEETENLDKGWQKSLDYFLGLLDDIQLGKFKLRDDLTGLEFPRSNTDLPSFYPNNQSNDDPNDPTASPITMNGRW